jgi:drug/metabolite transporter (DMT)-like permease
MDAARPSRALGLAAGAAIALIWGLSFVSIKVAVAWIPPMSLGFLRFALASAILFALKRGLEPHGHVRPAQVPALAAAGLIGVTAYFFMENNGVKLSSASEASVVIGAIPVLSLLAEVLFLGARLRPAQAIGALLSSAGVWVFVSAGLSARGDWRAYLYMSGAALSWVAYSFITRKLFQRLGRISIVFWQSLFGAISFIPFAIMEAGQWRVPPPGVWAHAAFLAVFCSALGYWFYVYSVEALGITVSSVFINLIPVIAVLAGFLFLGERMSTAQWIGGAAVLAGVFMATWPEKRPGRG